jgi:acyl-homoserine-lactone acylase
VFRIETIPLKFVRMAPSSFRSACAGALLFSALLSPDSAGAQAAAAAPETRSYTVEIHRSGFGVPHILASDHGNLGFGMGYAFAEDNLCELADMVLTLDGRRSLHFGPGDDNLARDFYFQRLLDTGATEAALAGPHAPSPEARALVRGYADGVNQYLRETGIDELPDPRCRGAAWVRELEEIDVYRMRRLRSAPLLAGTVAAAPPGDDQPVAAADDPQPDVTSMGSNAYAFGSEYSRAGRGVLLANPHYPWDGMNRFYRAHLTIPGRLDVVGAAIFGSPFVGIGHTERIAWTHTVSTAVRYGVFELSLAQDDPTRYLVEGRPVEMTTRTVQVPVRNPDGSVTEAEHTFHETPLGIVVHTRTYPWTRDRAFVVALPDAGVRVVDQYLAMYDAADVRELRDALLRWQATEFNTTAVDATGEAFYGDAGMIPHVTDAHAERCFASDLAREVWRTTRVPVLDGTRPDCRWGADPLAVVPGIFGPSHLPQIFRRDFVGQFNDSYWLSNPQQPIEGLPRILGEERTARSLRTRLGFQMVEDRVRGTDGLSGTGFDVENLWEVMFNNRNLGAEMVRDDLVEMCRQRPRVVVEDNTIDLSQACEVLADWDLRADLDSRGAHLFREFARADGLRFAVPFDPADPVNTPHTLDRGDTRVLEALGRAVHLSNAATIPLDATLGSVQTEPRGDRRVPIHGGPGGEGIFNVITAPYVPGEGYPKIVHGSSFVMAVEFTDSGPVSRGILTYSQSTNPESPHFADQTVLFSGKGWDDFRFMAEPSLDDPASRTYTVHSGAN